VIAWSLPFMAGHDRALFTVLFLLAIPTSLVKVSLPTTAATLSTSHVLGYLALFTLGTRAAVLVAAAAAWSQCVFRNPRRNPAPHQTVFSIAALALAMEMSGAIYVWLGGKPGAWETSTALGPFAAAATTFFLANSGLVAGAIAFTTAQPLGRIWFDTFLSAWPVYLLGAAMAAASVFAIQRPAPWLVLFLAVPFAVMFHNLRAYLERVDEATTDALTALPNQRFVLAHVARELALAKRRGTAVTIITVDLDGLKFINDTYGHRAGDVALRHVARCLQGSIRAQDVCGRYGGDEFLAVLSDCDRAHGEAKAVELQAAVDVLQVEVRPNVHVPVGISVGAAAYPDDGDSLDRLLETGDARMYADKLLRSSHVVGLTRG
jgi:diguanylate cyclase (GGDEF)-like protein